MVVSVVERMHRPESGGNGSLNVQSSTKGIPLVAGESEAQILAWQVRLVALLKSTWGEYESYCDAVGDKSDMVAFFTGPVQFINDFLDNMDYLGQSVVRQALLAVEAQGQVTIAQFDVPGAGDVWTHTFGKDGKYDFRKGGIRDLVKGHLPRRCIQKTG